MDSPPVAPHHRAGLPVQRPPAETVRDRTGSTRCWPGPAETLVRAQRTRLPGPGAGGAGRGVGVGGVGVGGGGWPGGRGGCRQTSGWGGATDGG